MPEPGLGAHRLHGQVQGALEPRGSGGVTVWSCVVQIETQVGPSGRLVAGVEPGQHVAVGGQLLAAERALAGGDVAGQVRDVVPWCGEPRVTMRRATSAPPSATQSRATTPPAE